MRIDAGPFLAGFGVLTLGGVVALFAAGEPVGHCWLQSNVPCELTFSSGITLGTIGTGLVLAGIVSGAFFAVLFVRSNLPKR